MTYLMWLSLMLLGCFCTVNAQEDTCEAGEVDNNIYLFGYGYSWSVYEFLNADGELMGLGYDITRTICKVMNKKCEHAVFYDYGYAYNEQGISISLNDGWYGALVNWVPTPQRLSSYDFSAPIAQEPSSYMYVRSGSRIDNIDEVKSDADYFGFRKGFYISPDCLGNYLGVSLAGKEKIYADTAEQEAALRNQDVDVIFVSEIDLVDKNAVKRIGGEPIQCASGGVSVMYRKDKSSMFSWYDEGLKKIQESGDYAWICNMNSNDVDPGCFDG